MGTCVTYRVLSTKIAVDIHLQMQSRLQAFVDVMARHIDALEHGRAPESTEKPTNTHAASKDGF